LCWPFVILSLYAVYHRNVNDSAKNKMHVSSPLSIRILTHNIRYATKSPFPGEALWAARLPLLASQFLYHTAYAPLALLCLQEVLYPQLKDLLVALNVASKGTDSPDWASIGVGRDDGMVAGEYAAIIYRPSIWSVIGDDTRWLSETPYTPGSKGWDAASVRIVTTAMLRHRESGREITLMNTHLDDQGIVARREAAKMLRILARSWSLEGRSVVLTGDLNSEADGDAYRVLTGKEGAGNTMVDMRFKSQYLYGDKNTFTGFEGKADELTRLDYIFVSQEVDCKCDGYGVLPNRFEDGVYLSDHRAVVVDLRLPQGRGDEA